MDSFFRMVIFYASATVEKLGVEGPIRVERK